MVSSLKSHLTEAGSDELVISCNASYFTRDRDEQTAALDVCRKTAIGVFIEGDGAVNPLCTVHARKREIARQIPMEAVDDRFKSW